MRIAGPRHNGQHELTLPGSCHTLNYHGCRAVPSPTRLARYRLSAPAHPLPFFERARGVVWRSTSATKEHLPMRLIRRRTWTIRSIMASILLGASVAGAAVLTPSRAAAQSPYIWNGSATNDWNT